MFGKDEGGDWYPAHQSPGTDPWTTLPRLAGRSTKTVEKLEHTIQKLKTIEAHLKPSRHFHDEIAEMNTYIKELGLECQKFKLA